MKRTHLSPPYRIGVVFVVGLAAFAGCGPIDAVDAGHSLYADAKLSVSPSNVFSCATCHADTPDKQAGDRVYSGYTLFGAAQRPSYWGGQMTLLLDAVNFCLSEFMRGEKLTTGDNNGLALLAYLQSIAAEPDQARPLTIIPNINDTYLATLPPGDATRGAAGYKATCAPCHGDVHSGNGRLGSYVSALPDDTVESFGAQARAITVEKIRHGKFFGISGNMPFYSLEAMAEQDASDIVTYLFP